MKFTHPKSYLKYVEGCYCIYEVKGYEAVVEALSKESLTNFFPEIEVALNNFFKKGTVFLDYGLYSESEKRQYYEINFNGKTFDIKSMSLCKGE